MAFFISIEGTPTLGKKFVIVSRTRVWQYQAEIQLFLPFPHLLFWSYDLRHNFSSVVVTSTRQVNENFEYNTKNGYGMPLLQCRQVLDQYTQFSPSSFDILNVSFRIVGCTHINAQTAVLVETLVYLGAQVTTFTYNYLHYCFGSAQSIF